MKNKNNVLLCSTLHDPRGVFLGVLQQASLVVLKDYKGWVVNVTGSTDQKVKDALQDLSPQGVFMTETDPHKPIVSEKIENDHLYLLLQTVGISKELGIKKIQYTDGDRVITAATHYPDDLHDMASRAAEIVGDSKSYVNFRRTVDDYFSHHPPLVQTEFEFNRLYSEVFGMPIDIGSTAHGMSLDVLEEVLHRSPQMESVSFPHPKWLLIAKEMGIPIRSEEVPHVLTFETPDQFKNEVRERITLYDFYPDPSYEKLQKDYMATLGLDSTVSPIEWDLRFRTERQYLTILKNYLNIFNYDEEKENELSNEINKSLISMEGRQEAINEVLRKSSEEGPTSTNPEGS